MEALSSFAERILNALVWPRDVAVERHRDVKSQSAHRAPIRLAECVLIALFSL
jgi:hypothetical protein